MNRKEIYRNMVKRSSSIQKVMVVGDEPAYKRQKTITEKEVMRAFVKLGKCVTGAEALKVIMNPYMDLRPDVVVDVYGHYKNTITPFEWNFVRADAVVVGGLCGFQCLANTIGTKLWSIGGATNSLARNGAGAPHMTVMPAGFNEDLDTAMTSASAGMLRKTYAKYKVIRNKITVIVENREAFDVFIGARVETLEVVTGATALSIPEVFPALGAIDMSADRTIEDLDDVLPGFTLTKVYGTVTNAEIRPANLVKSLTIDVPVAKLQNKMAREGHQRIDQQAHLISTNVSGIPGDPGSTEECIVQFIVIPVSAGNTLTTEDESGHFRTTLIAVTEAFTEQKVLFTESVRLDPVQVLLA